VSEKGSLTGQYKGALSDCRELSLTYSSLYKDPASLAILAGVYTSADQEVHTLTLTIHADGQMDGSDLRGCVVVGSVTVPDSTKNYYSGTADVTSCGDLNGHYDGMLSLIDNSQLRVALSNSGAAIFGALQR
jgi:hypothetical protein